MDDLTKAIQSLDTKDGGGMRSLIPLVYQELKRLAKANLRSEQKNRSLETTGLVHEAYLKLHRSRPIAYENRSHFYGIMSRLMRQVLVENARTRNAQKRGANLEIAVSKLPDLAPHSDKSLLALNDALIQLEKVDQAKARLIEMRYFAGMTADECSSLLAVPTAEVRRELRLAEAWLRMEMGQHKSGS
jgi:RNA polymerase sigma-70 factor, ECF subfamily